MFQSVENGIQKHLMGFIIFHTNLTERQKGKGGF